MGDGKGFGSENIKGALPRIISQFDICMETSSSLSMSKLVVEKAFPTGLIKLKILEFGLVIRLVIVLHTLVGISKSETRDTQRSHRFSILNVSVNNLINYYESMRTYMVNESRGKSYLLTKTAGCEWPCLVTFRPRWRIMKTWMVSQMH